MKFDLQDALLLAGGISLVGGVAWIYKPAGMILFGLLCLAAVMMIERAKKTNGPPN